MSSVNFQPLLPQVGRSTDTRAEPACPLSGAASGALEGGRRGSRMTQAWSSSSPLEPTGEESPLARARLHRQLTIEETARRAGLTAGGSALARGRTRLPLPDAGRRADRDRSCTPRRSGSTTAKRASSPGCPSHRSRSSANPLPRLLVIGARRDRARRLRGAAPHPALRRKADAARPPSAILPPPWRIQVTVLNGSGDINYTRQVASRIGAFGYSDQEGRPRRQLHVPADRGLLPAEVRGRRRPAREAARRRDEASPRRGRPVPAVRDRRPRARAGRIAPTAAACGAPASLVLSSTGIGSHATPAGRTDAAAPRSGSACGSTSTRRGAPPPPRAPHR